MIIVQRQIEIFDKLKESSQIVFNDTYTNHQILMTSISTKYGTAKDTMFLPNQYNQNVVNTMSEIRYKFFIRNGNISIKIYSQHC